MKKPKIDESKRIEVMNIIEAAVNLTEKPDFETNKAAKKELLALQKKLHTITGNKSRSIKQFIAYNAFTDLRTAAEMALMPNPVKAGLTDKQLSEIISNICSVKYSEAEMDYFLEILEVETGLDNVSDYIFYPDIIDPPVEDNEEAIIARILADKNNE